MKEDVFEASESSDSDLEVSEGLHRDFEKSSQWGKSLQMLKKMGWKEGEGLGRKQKGMVQIRSGPKKSDHEKDRGARSKIDGPKLLGLLINKSGRNQNNTRHALSIFDFRDEVEDHLF